MTIELRDSGFHWSLGGLASTYGTSYFVAHGDGRGLPFRETILPGAFASATRAHVELRIEHDSAGPVLASTTGRTMRLEDDRDGLVLGAALAKRSRDAQDAAERIKSGELRSFSVGMNVPEGGDLWPAPNERHVIRATLNEVSLVRSPCNPGAAVTAFRHETRSAGIEYRSVPLTYRQVSGETMESYADAEPDNDETPPHLRTAATGAAEKCSTCAAWDRSSGICRMFTYPTKPDQVCDKWADTWAPSYARAKRVFLAASGTEELQWQLALRGRR